jgi:V/A-type H+-transporting ATPase subunit D
MIHPTRTNLLLLREKARSVANSVGILKARRQALIQELLVTSQPFLQSREEVKSAFAKGLDELHVSLGHEGEAAVVSLAEVLRRTLGVEIQEKRVMGLRYREVTVREALIRTLAERPYDYASTNPHLEETIHIFETILEEMLNMSAYESKLRRLGNEILKISRRTRVLEERVLPEVRQQIRTIALYISERERESYYRLKRFKEIRSR